MNAALPPGAAAPQDPAAADELRTLIAQLRTEVQGLAQRLAALEARPGAPAPIDAAHSSSGAQAAAAQHAAPATPARDAGVTEDDMLAIAAAVAAFLGVRAQIRQVRLVQSAAWAQMGRATIHASHRI